jgi:hypothetical protein
MVSLFPISLYLLIYSTMLSIALFPICLLSMLDRTPGLCHNLFRNAQETLQAGQGKQNRGADGLPLLS